MSLVPFVSAKLYIMNMYLEYVILGYTAQSIYIFFFKKTLKYKILSRS